MVKYFQKGRDFTGRREGSELGYLILLERRLFLIIMEEREKAVRFLQVIKLP